MTIFLPGFHLCPAKALPQRAACPPTRAGWACLSPACLLLPPRYWSNSFSPADVEIAVQGCLRDTLFELSEAVHWGLLDPAFAEQQRLRIYNQAAVELVGPVMLQNMGGAKVCKLQRRLQTEVPQLDLKRWLHWSSASWQLEASHAVRRLDAEPGLLQGLGMSMGLVRTPYSVLASVLPPSFPLLCPAG